MLYSWYFWIRYIGYVVGVGTGVGVGDEVIIGSGVEPLSGVF